MARALCKLGHCQRLLAPGPRLQVLPVANKFWEPDHRGGYDTKIKHSIKDRIKEIPKIIPEIKKWKEEWEDNLHMDKFIPVEHGDYEVIWKFDETDTINKWIVTADSDHNEGKSNAEFILGKNKKGIFRGNLNTEVPKDGITKRAGYANIKSPRKRISFHREKPYDWLEYTHLVIRCRGDGRPYNLILNMQRYFDLQWHDMYSYPLYTRGGPYWQTAKIPFSKFMLAAKGRVQDKQESVVNELDRISHVSVSIMDNASGPFQLEIDYMAVLRDSTHTEHFAYEMYKCAPEVHGG